jgi:hypothetical protein
LRQLGDLPKLLRLLAAHTASTVTKATLSRESGIPETTLPPYLDLLETLYLIQRVPAWSNNLAGRVSKAPKIAHPDPSGRLIETFVLSELRKQLPHADTAPALLHWRDRTGPEIDIILKAPDGRIVGIEVKAAATLRASDFKWLAVLRDGAPRRFAGGFVLHTGRTPHPSVTASPAHPYSPYGCPEVATGLGIWWASISSTAVRGAAIRGASVTPGPVRVCGRFPGGAGRGACA